MATQIACEIKNLVAYITIFEENERRPCTLDWESIAALEGTLDNIAKDDTVRAVVLQSASPKSFVVGANIHALEKLDNVNIMDWVKNGHCVFNKLQQLNVPTIAKVEKYALGGGLELAMACDMIFATTEARFAQPEATLGVMPGWGGSYRLTKLIGPARAKEMFFTGRQISAEQAYQWGLVNHVYAPDEIDSALEEVLSAIRDNDAGVLHYVKEIVNTHTQSGIAQNALEEANTSSICMSSPSTKARLAAFFASRKK